MCKSIDGVQRVILVPGITINLMIDKYYRCWLVDTDISLIKLPIPRGYPLSDYCLDGYDKFTGREICDMIPDAIAKLNNQPTKEEVLNGK